MFDVNRLHAFIDEALSHAFSAPYRMKTKVTQQAVYYRIEASPPILQFVNGSPQGGAFAAGLEAVATGIAFQAGMLVRVRFVPPNG